MCGGSGGGSVGGHHHQTTSLGSHHQLLHHRSSLPLASTHEEVADTRSSLHQLDAEDRRLKEVVHTACDRAHSELRQKEQQLMRVLDAAACRRRSALWDQCMADDALLMRSGACAPGRVSLQIDSDVLQQCIDGFASVHIEGLTEAASPASSLPSGLEDYGAEEHLVLHKPLPVDPTWVRVAPPPILPEVTRTTAASESSSADSFEVISTPATDTSNVQLDQEIDQDLSLDSSDDLNKVQGQHSVIKLHPFHNDIKYWLLPGYKLCDDVGEDDELLSSADSALGGLSLSGSDCTEHGSMWLLKPTELTDWRRDWLPVPVTWCAAPPISGDSGCDLLEPFHRQAACVSWTAAEIAN